MVKNEELIIVRIDDVTLQVKVLYKKVKYLRIKILPNKNVIIISKYRLKENEVLEIINNNKINIFKFLNKKRLVLSHEEVMIFGKKYLKTEIDYQLMYSKAIELIKNMFEEIRIKYNFENVQVYFSKMKSRWGVCYPKKKRIGLSIYLTYVPLDCVEYVIVHEFVHLKICNHSKEFYNELAKLYPNYKNAVKQLKEYGSLLN